MNKPNLKSTQFALLVVDGLTGIVLNTNFEKFINDRKEVYFIFDDLQSVRDFILKVNEKSDTYDYTIYDSNYKIIDFIQSKKWL